MDNNLKVLGGYAQVLRSEFNSIKNNKIGIYVYVTMNYTDEESRSLLVDKLKSIGFRDLNEYQTEKDVMNKYFIVNPFEEEKSNEN